MKCEKEILWNLEKLWEYFKRILIEILRKLNKRLGENIRKTLEIFTALGNKLEIFEKYFEETGGKI